MKIGFAFKNGAFTYSMTQGFHNTIIHEISKNLNFEFSLKSDLLSDPDNPFDCLIGYGRYNFYYEIANDSFLTWPYIYLNDVIAVPPGLEYDNYEKFVIAFDYETWIFIILIFAIALLMIFIMRFTKPEHRNFVFGRNISSPSLNIVMIFFGVSQIKLPGRNFARYIMMVFILYCLIIRTAWQGKIFEFM